MADFLREIDHPSAVVWLVRTEDGTEVEIWNPRMEPDCTDDGHHFHAPEWDYLRIAGEPLTDEQQDEYTDELRDEVRRLCAE